MHITPVIQQIEFDRSLIEKYGDQGFLRTAYPTADRFAELGPASYPDMLLRSRVGEADKPASLHFYLPFCDAACYYCVCNNAISNNQTLVVGYAEYLQKEIKLHADILPYRMKVGQIHFGGGTPTLLPEAQLVALMQSINQNFDILTDGEYSIEIDPRQLELSKVGLLAKVGFNRMSVGVQDFDEQVQRAVNRIQSEAQTRQVVNAARSHGFRSVGIDLIYGLPFQSASSVLRTLERVLDIRPDRIALYHYTHQPEHFRPQQNIDAATLPSPAQELDILQAVVERLGAAGYIYIGMDHFALPEDDLAIAQRRGALQCRFQGYSNWTESDLLAFGVSAMGNVGGGYFQNSVKLDDYYAKLDQSKLPIESSYLLTIDDLLRRSVIHGLMCRFNLDFGQIETAWLLDFKAYFAPEMARLAEMEKDGLLELSAEGIDVTPKGRMLIRPIAMVFDRHLREKTPPLATAA